MADLIGANSVEKLEDVIVRSAEQVAGQIRAAKDAISTVIFGQDRVVENTLVTILSGGHALLIGVPGLAKTKLVETLGITLGLDAKRIQFTPDLMPSDILGAEVLDESSSGQAVVPLHRRAGVRAAPDGRRNQPRQPAHPVRAAAGDAGAAHHGRRRAPRPAETVPCAGDAKPAGAGRHLSAAGSAARSLPDGDRRRLSGSRRRAADPVRNHRRRRDAGQGGDERRDPDHGAAAGAAAAGRRFASSRRSCRWSARRVRARKAARTAS